MECVQFPLRFTYIHKNTFKHTVYNMLIFMLHELKGLVSFIHLFQVYSKMVA